MNLQKLEEIASNCTLCSLYKGRIKPVFAKGNPESKIMICGMVPAGDENKVGVPFVGRAGKLLDQLLEDANLTLNDVYITNLVKCYLAAGKSLEQIWIDACLPYLIVQIEAIRPRVIITLGKDSSINLLGMDNKTSLSSIHGKVFDCAAGIKIVPTYHPSYVLRKGGKTSDVYQTVLADFQIAEKMIEKRVKKTIGKYVESDIPY